MKRAHMRGSERDGCNLRAVAPLAEEGKDEGLNEDGAKDKAGEVACALECALGGARSAHGRL